MNRVIATLNVISLQLKSKQWFCEIRCKSEHNARPFGLNRTITTAGQCLAPAQKHWKWWHQGFLVSVTPQRPFWFPRRIPEELFCIVVQTRIPTRKYKLRIYINFRNFNAEDELALCCHQLLEIRMWSSFSWDCFSEKFVENCDFLLLFTK